MRELAVAKRLMNWEVREDLESRPIFDPASLDALPAAQPPELGDARRRGDECRGRREHCGQRRHCAARSLGGNAVKRGRALRRRYGRSASRRQAFHYIAAIKGSAPTRFYAGSGPIANAAAAAFSGWAKADVVLWPTHERGVYTAKWFDKFSDTFRETKLTIIEEAAR